MNIVECFFVFEIILCYLYWLWNEENELGGIYVMYEFSVCS